MLNVQIMMIWYFKSKEYVYCHHVAIRDYLYAKVPLGVYSEDCAHRLKVNLKRRICNP